MNIEKLISEMTLEEKIGQMSQTFMEPGVSPDKICKMIENGEVGSVILAETSVAGNTGDGFETSVADFFKAAAKKSRLKIPVILGRDVIHGHKIIFPIPLAQAASWNMELIEISSELAAKEARMDGVEWTFAPMLDLSRDPRWGRIIEGYGEDPYPAARAGEASVKGFEKVILACGKHFVGYGAAEGGRDYSQSQISDYELYNMYLPAFRAAIEAGCSTVMNSFAAVNGVPCVANSELMRGVLKEDLGFEGYVISDWGSPKWLINHGLAENDAECAELSVKAGVDMEMATTTYRENLKHLVSEGKISTEMIDECVRRILKMKERFTEKTFSTTNEDELFEAAERISDETMILLKNDNNALPLRKNEKIFLAGPYAEEKKNLCGSWSGGGAYEKTITLYEGIVRIAPESEIILAADQPTLERQLRCISKCDTVIVALGEPAGVTGERSSVADICVPEDQLAILRQCRKRAEKLITVIFGGRPLALTEVDEMSDAVLYAWHSGITSGKSAAKIIFGDVVPSGKTPVSFLHSSGQIPMYYNMPHLPIPAKDEGVPVYYGEPLFASYADELSVPLYPFGYGLSYTEFEYSDVAANCTEISAEKINNGDTVEVSVDVSNIGNVDAKEVVQLYIHANKSAVMRPVRELKGFKKLLIKQRECETVKFTLGLKEFGYYVDRKLIVEKGRYDVWVGGSCYADKHIVIEIL